MRIFNFNFSEVHIGMRKTGMIVCQLLNLRITVIMSVDWSS